MSKVSGDNYRNVGKLKESLAIVNEAIQYCTDYSLESHSLYLLKARVQACLGYLEDAEYNSRIACDGYLMTF